MGVIPPLFSELPGATNTKFGEDIGQSLALTLYVIDLKYLKYFENFYLPEKLHPAANNDNKNNIKLADLTINNTYKQQNIMFFFRNQSASKATG